MGGWSARKALKVIDNVEICKYLLCLFQFQSDLLISVLVLAIELLMACQAIDLLHPLTTTRPLQAVHDLVRQSIA
jgi:histidine ammonia-lyase